MIRFQARSSWARRGAVLCLALALAVLGITVGTWRYQEQQAINEVGGAMARAAGAFARGLEDSLQAKRHAMEILAEVLGGDQRATAFGSLAESLTGPQGGFRWIARVDEYGRVLTTTDPETVRGGASAVPVQAPTGATVAVAIGQDFGVLITVPIAGRQGETPGAVQGLLPLAWLDGVASRLIQRLPGRFPWQAGSLEYQCLGPDGELVLDSDLRQAGLVNMVGLKLPSVLAVRSSETVPHGFIEEIHLRRHVPVVTGYARLEHLAGWAVLLRLDRSVVVWPIRSRIGGYGATGVLVLLGAAVLLSRVGRRRTVEVVPQPHASPSMPEPVKPAFSYANGQHDLPRDGLTRAMLQVQQRCRRIDEVMSRAMERLANLGGTGPERWQQQTIEALGLASGATRLTQYRYVLAPHGREQVVRVRLCRRWPEASSRSDADAPGNAAPPGWWYARHSKGELVQMPRVEASVPEHEALIAEGVQSVVAIPLFVRQDCWGFLRFDDCDGPRDWTAPELDALRAAARLIGTALSLQDRERELERALCLMERTFDTAGKGVMLTDGDGQIVGVNKAFLTMWDVPDSIATFRDHYQLLAHLLTRLTSPELFLRTMAELGGTPMADSYDLVELADGRIFERTSQPQSDRQDDVARIWSFTDITDAPPDRPSTAAAPSAAVSRPTQEAGGDAAGETAERVHALSLRLESVREQERRRLARDIHDQLGQALTGLKLDLAALSGKLTKDYEEFRAKADAMSELVSQTMHTVRRISSDLRPPILDDLGLPAAIEWQAQEFHARSGVSCAVDIDPDLQLEEPRATALFRIFQEALTNVARHAHATAVAVAVRGSSAPGRPPGRGSATAADPERQGVVLEVHDNGRGIEEREIHDPCSIGLAGMRERAAMLGGRVSVRGRAGEGTTVTVFIPTDGVSP